MKVYVVTFQKVYEFEWPCGVARSLVGAFRVAQDDATEHGHTFARDWNPTQQQSPDQIFEREIDPFTFYNIYSFEAAE